MMIGLGAFTDVETLGETTSCSNARQDKEVMREQKQM